MFPVTSEWSGAHTSRPNPRLGHVGEVGRGLMKPEHVPRSESPETDDNGVRSSCARRARGWSDNRGGLTTWLRKRLRRLGSATSKHRESCFPVAVHALHSVERKVEWAQEEECRVLEGRGIPKTSGSSPCEQLGVVEPALKKLGVVALDGVSSAQYRTRGVDSSLTKHTPARSTMINLYCFPDTVDPRGPKVK